MLAEWSLSPPHRNNIRRVQLHNDHKTYNDMEPELESFLVLVFRPPDRAVWSKAVYKASRTSFCHRTVKSLRHRSRGKSIVEGTDKAIAT